MKTTTNLNSGTILIKKNESELSHETKHKNYKFLFEQAQVLKSQLNRIKEFNPDTYVKGSLQEVDKIAQSCKSRNILLLIRNESTISNEKGKNELANAKNKVIELKVLEEVN